MRDFLIKFLGTSIFAGGVLIISKLISVWIALSITSGKYSIQMPYTEGALFRVANEAQLSAVLQKADLIFVALVVIVGGIILAKTLLFNDLTRNPRVLVRVIHLNLTDWLEDGKVMYPKLFAWSIFLWVATGIVFNNYLESSTPLYISAICFIFTIYYTYQVFSFLDKHISDMISYIHGDKKRYI